MKKVLLTLVAIVIAQLSMACTANFSYSASPYGSALLRFTFTNTTSYGSLGTSHIYYNVIYFGDGTYSTIGATSTVYHTYTSTGTYSVKLRAYVYDSSSSTVTCSDSITKSVTVGWPSCGDSIYVSYGSGGSVTFTAHCPAGTTGLTRSWTFGDGTITTSGNPITHTYTYNGTYNVYLQDTSTTGCTYLNYTTVTITTGSWNCAYDTARFSASVSGPVANFYSTTRPPSGVHMKYKWNFGDGSSILTSTSYYTSHTYSSSGTYTVKLYTLWVDSSTGTTIYCTDSTTHTITAGSWSCGNDTARFSASVAGSTVSFYSPSRAPTPLMMKYKWDYGDGSSVVTSYSYTRSHSYTSTGTYTVKLITIWYDSSTSSIICEDSITHSVTTGSYSCGNDTARFYSYSSGLSWTFYSSTRPPVQ